MADDKSVTVRLTAEVSQYDSAITGSAAKTEAAAGRIAAAASKTDLATKKATGSAGVFSSAWSKAGATLSKTSSALVKHQESVGRLSSGMMMAGGAIALGLAGAVAKAAQFDKAMSKVASTGEDARGNLVGLRQAAIDYGAATQFSATEAAEGITNLIKAGVSARDVLGGGLAGTLSLAAAGELGVADAAEIAATAITQFHLAGSDMGHVADLLAAGAGKAQGEVVDLAAGLKYVGPVASGMKVSLEETVGALSAFASQGILGEQAGTSLRGVLGSLTSPSAQAKKEIDRLGLTLYDSQGKFLGLTNMAGQLEGAYSGMSDAQKDFSLGLIFGNAQVTAARVLVDQGAEGMQNWTDQVNEAGYAAKAAALMTDNLSGDIERLGGSIDTALISSGSGLNQALRPMIQGAEDAVNAIAALPAPLIDFGTRAAAITAVTMLAGGGLLKMGLGAAQAYEAFQNLKTSAPGVASGLGKLAKAGVWAMGIMAVATAVGALQQATQGETLAHGLEGVTDALLRMKSSTDTTSLDDAFKVQPSTLNDVGALTTGVTDLGSGIDRLFHKGVAEHFDDMMGGIFSFAGIKSGGAKVQQVFNDMDASLSRLASSGNAELAAQQFSKVAEAMSMKGVDAQGILSTFPEYEAQLRSTANSMGGIQLSAEEMVAWMGGQVPAAVSAAAAAHPELVAQLDATGQAALNTANGLKAETDAMFEAANAALQLSGSQVGYAAAVDEANKAIKENGKNTKLSTEAGRENRTAIDNIAASGLALVKNLQDTGAAGTTVTKAMKTARSDFLAAAHAAGYTADQAAALADAYQLVPENVNTKVDQQGAEAAKGEADALTAAMKKIPKSQQAKVQSEFERGGVDAAYAALRAIDGETATTYITTIRRVQANLQHPTGKAERASGGSVFGPGTATSDSIPAMLSDGEHVWSAAEVQAAGGHQAMEAARAQARRGQLHLAEGGPVHLAKGGSAKSKAAAAKRKREAAAKKAKEEAKQRAQERADLLRELKVDVRRDNIGEDVDSGQGLNVIDQMLDWSRNKALSSSKRSSLGKTAASAEKSLTSLYKKLDVAKDRVTDLQSIYDSVAQGLGRYDISDSLKSTWTETSDGQGNVRQTEHKATGASMAAAASGQAAKLKTFAGKMAQMVAAGASPALMAQISSLPPDEGIAVCDSFLADASSIKGMNQALADIDTYSKQAAQTVTEASYAGGLAAAKGLVTGLEKEIGKVGDALASAFASALGYKIKDGKMVKRASGGPIWAGRPTMVGENGKEVLIPASNGFVLNQRQAESALRAGSVGSSVQTYTTNYYLDGVKVEAGNSREATVLAEFAQMAGRLAKTGVH